MFVKEIIKNKINEQKNNRIKQVLDVATFNPVNNIQPKSVSTIGIVVPTLHKYTGGHTSIIRLGSLLVDRGYIVSYISYENQPITEMQEVLKANYSSSKGKCVSFDQAQKDKYDIVLATNWISVYWAKLLDGYKAYFVQDYEPYFFMVDEEYELAKETYELGFHIISLGKWNIEQINKNCINKGIQSFIEFPYEPSEYKYKRKNFSEKKKEIKIAVYTKENGKRMANLMQYMLLNAVNEFESRGFHLDVSFFGLNKDYRVHNQNSLNRALERIVRNCNEEIIGKSSSPDPILLPRIHCHMLRHTFGTRLNDANANIKAMQALLGHSDLETTMQIYVDASSQIMSRATGEYGKMINEMICRK